MLLINNVTGDISAIVPSLKPGEEKDRRRGGREREVKEEGENGEQRGRKKQHTPNTRCMNNCCQIHETLSPRGNK